METWVWLRTAARAQGVQCDEAAQLWVAGTQTGEYTVKEAGTQFGDVMV